MPTRFGQGSYRRPTRSQHASQQRSSGVVTLRLTPNNLLIELEVPYNAAFTDEFKKSIPAKKRQWEGANKLWFVARDQFDKLTILLGKYFDPNNIHLLDFPAPQVSGDSWGRLYLVEGAPVQVVQAAYRALSMIHHPDKGGDSETMKSINEAYKELMKGYQNGDL